MYTISVSSLRFTTAIIAVISSMVSLAEVNPGNPTIASIASEFGCQLDYEYYLPNQQEPLTTIVLAHGFMRDLTSIRGWALHWQQHDISTVIVSFCNSNLLNGHHQRNAKDLVAIRQHLQLNKVIYSGFSAGGLAAYLAAIDDDQAQGYLGLDSVDSGKLAVKEDRDLRVPALFLLAGPSSCNARNNILDTITKQEYPVSHIDGATHCHFESPYDKRCGWLCGRSTAEDTVNIQQDIMDQATNWVLAIVTTMAIPLEDAVKE